MQISSLTTRRWAPALMVMALLVGACGSDGDGDGDAADDDDTTTTTEATDETTTTADTTETTDDPGDDVEVEGALFLAPPEEGAELVIEDSGFLSGTTTMTVVSVEESDAGITVSTSEVVASEGAEPVTVERTYTTAPDGSLSVSADAFVAQGPGFEVTAAGDDILIPSVTELADGEERSGETFVELAAEGIDGRTDVTYTVTGGGTESLTTPLGTFDVQIVSLDLTVSSTITGDQTGTIRFSFLPGFGVLKTETSIAGFEIVSTVVSSTVAP